MVSMSEAFRSTDDTQLSGNASTMPAQAGPTQGIPLILATSMPVLAVVIVAPVLPAMQDHFTATPMAPMLVPMSMTIPSFMMAVVAPTIGLILDLYGRRRVLIGGVVAFAGIGIAPLWLQSLHSIMLSRALLGVVCGVVIVAITTFLCDMYTGVRRDRYLGLQTFVASLAAMTIFAVGGGLGAISWRLPFAVLAVVLLLVPFLIRTVPAQRRVVAAQGPNVRHRRLPPMPWARLLRRCAITVFAAIVFNAPIVETTFLLQRFDVSSASTIGMIEALTSLATVVGGVIFLELSTTEPKRLLVGGLGVATVGFAVIALAARAPAAVGGAIVVAGLVGLCVGCGVLLPTVLTWTMRAVNDGQRGRGAGLWVASFYLGQFVCPLIVRALSRGAGGLFPAFGLLAVACTAMVGAVLVTPFARRRSRHRGTRRSMVHGSVPWTQATTPWQPAPHQVGPVGAGVRHPTAAGTTGVNSASRGPAQPPTGPAQPATARTAAPTRSRSLWSGQPPTR